MQKKLLELPTALFSPSTSNKWTSCLNFENSSMLH